MGTVTKTQPQTTIKSLLTSEAIKNQLAVALPKHMSADRMARVALTALLRTPKLANCSQESFMQCLLGLSSMGLEPDGRNAHLIPYGNDCTLVVDYKGLVALAMRSGRVANIHADVVREHDIFIYEKGDIKSHSIDFKTDRGEVYAVYALCRMKDGTEKCEVMSKDEVEAIRKRSKSGNNGPWKTDWNEMAKKSAFRRLSKWLELSPEYRDALDVDDDPRISGDVIDTTATSPAARLTQQLEEPDNRDRDWAGEIAKAGDPQTLDELAKDIERDAGTGMLSTGEAAFLTDQISERFNAIQS